MVPTAPDWPVWVRIMLTITLTWYGAPSGSLGALKETVLARNAPFGSSEGPGGPDLVPTAPDWAAWVGIMVTTHFDLVSGPFQVPGGPKRAFWPRSLNFHGPISWATFFCFKNRLVGCPEHRSGMPCSSSTVIAHMEPPSSRKRPKTGKKGPFGPPKDTFGGPGVTRRASGCQSWS